MRSKTQQEDYGGERTGINSLNRANYNLFLLINLSYHFDTILSQILFEYVLSTLNSQVDRMKQDQDDGNITMLSNSVLIEINSDEDYESIFKRHEVKLPIKKCSTGNVIKKICTNEQCDHPALYCSSEECQKCFQNHESCENVLFSGLALMLKNRELFQKNFFHRIFKISQQLIEKIHKSNDEMVKMITLGSFDKKYVEQLDSIFSKSDASNFKGIEGKELYKKVREKYSSQEGHEKQLEKIYQLQSHRVIDENIKLKNDLFSCFLKKTKINSVVQEKPFIESALLRNCLNQIYANNPKCYENMNKQLDSYEMSFDVDKKASDKEYIKFLKDSLNSPIKAELIFRASQHKYLAAKFHEKCDGVENTLTIVRTEFGKTIFAFAAQKWNSSSGYVNDTTGRSCIVLLDIKKKCGLTNAAYSIYCTSSYGPRFGGDLHICDGCDKSNGSGCDFPHSYNCNGEFTKNQIAYTTICGAPNGNNFKVIDYEVHKLIYA